jgi:hypothetical protein
MNVTFYQSNNLYAYMQFRWYEEYIYCIVYDDNYISDWYEDWQSRMHAYLYMHGHCCLFSVACAGYITYIPYYYATIQLYIESIDIVCHFENAYADVIYMSDQLHIYTEMIIFHSKIISLYDLPLLSGSRSIINRYTYSNYLVDLVAWQINLRAFVLCDWYAFDSVQHITRHVRCHGRAIIARDR